MISAAMIVASNATSGNFSSANPNSVNFGKGFKYVFFNESVINQFKAFTAIKVLIVVLLILCCIMIIMRMYGIRSVFRGSAVSKEIAHVDDIRSRDLFILRTNFIMKWASKWTKRVGLEISPERKEYMKYNLERANVRAPGGYRFITPEEFNGITKLFEALFLLGGIVVFLFINMFMGAVCMIATSVIINLVPMQIVRRVVAHKDDIIKEEFPDLYLMLHYELLSGGETPLQTTLRSYGRSTNVLEMLKFVEDCVNIIDTYDIMTGVMHITDLYREIPQVTRIMRLIKQQNEGANIDTELIGFRDSLIKDQKHRKEKKKDRLVAKARASFYLTYIILFQAVISAMAIYLPDLGIIHF